MKKKIKPVLVVNILKTGGILQLIPIFAGLSTLGILIGYATAIAKAVNSAKSAKEQLAQRHYNFMEKKHYLRPYNTGLGLFYTQETKKLMDSLPQRTLTNIAFISYTKLLKIPHFKGIFAI